LIAYLKESRMNLGIIAEVSVTVAEILELRECNCKSDNYNILDVEIDDTRRTCSDK
jgi:hypothetical protein